MSRLTVIIPTRNRSDSILKLLDSINSQTLSNKLFEVVVVDNGSIDHTSTKVSGWIQEKSRFNCRLVIEPRVGLHFARHKGLASATSEFLVFCDDDILPRSTWLEGHWENFTINRAELSVGDCRPNYVPKPGAKWMRKLWLHSGFNSSRRSIPHISVVQILTPSHDDFLFAFGANFGVRKSSLLRHGGFHPDSVASLGRLFRGDGETHVARQIHSAGGRIFYSPKAIVMHEIPGSRQTPRYALKRAFDAGIELSFVYHRGLNVKKENIVKVSSQNVQMGRSSNSLNCHFSPYLILFRWIIFMPGAIFGFVIHSAVFLFNSKLRVWVSRPDYLD